MNDHDIRIAHDVEDVEYFHVLFEHHEIMMTNGAPTESFFPGDYALDRLDHAIQQELQALFPQLAHAACGFGPSARASIRPRDAAVLRRADWQ